MKKGKYLIIKVEGIYILRRWGIIWLVKFLDVLEVFDLELFLL